MHRGANDVLHNAENLSEWVSLSPLFVCYGGDKDEQETIAREPFEAFEPVIREIGLELLDVELTSDEFGRLSCVSPFIRHRELR